MQGGSGDVGGECGLLCKARFRQVEARMGSHGSLGWPPRWEGSHRSTRTRAQATYITRSSTSLMLWPRSPPARAERRAGCTGGICSGGSRPNSGAGAREGLDFSPLAASASREGRHPTARRIAAGPGAATAFALHSTRCTIELSIGPLEPKHITPFHRASILSGIGKLIHRSVMDIPAAVGARVLGAADCAAESRL